MNVIVRTLWQIGTKLFLAVQPLTSKSCRETGAVKKYAWPLKYRKPDLCFTSIVDEEADIKQERKCTLVKLGGHVLNHHVINSLTSDWQRPTRLKYLYYDVRKYKIVILKLELTRKVILQQQKTLDTDEIFWFLHQLCWGVLFFHLHSKLL